MRWTLKEVKDQESVNHLVQVLGIDPVLAQLLVDRGITTYEQAKSFFRPSLDELHDPYLMKDMDKAVKRIEDAIDRKENIMVFGDYDVDGTTAVALVYSYLQSYYPQVDRYIPDRYKEGYGVSYQGIDYAADNDIKLIIALDCGIKSVEHVEYAKQKGVDFVIGDHHLPGNQIPDAVAVLDPKRSDCSYPYDELCGCGVGFKLVQALAANRNQTIEDLMPYLDLVVTAIGADIVPITGENRILAYFGLEVLNSNPRPGIKALLNLYKQSSYTVSDIVFKVAPKINAAGRIQHGNYAVDLLTRFSMREAEETAEMIIAFNEERKVLDQNITEEAKDQIIENREINNKSTVVFHQSWHKGVIGIVASRLIETYYRPTVVFTASGDVLAASARSVKNFDLYAALEACSDELIQFGGHMYAAGMTCKKENYLNFKAKFEAIVADTIQERDLIPEVEIDAILNFAEITPKFCRVLKQFEPFGPENMSPIFLTKNVYDTGYARGLGANQDHLKMYVRQRGHLDKGFSAIGFSFGKYLDEIQNRAFFDLVYSIEENEWKGEISNQLQIKDMQLV
ncbi:single-stranded-DNA-specific exonuclease RecJ [Myroides odoratus]|uniref:Single-stranded-DNA-specific exonuclease RecJ n=1 Tax=Myroides odoratus TaxID=256 RepID=A0A378U3F5_MYROD|nr:single-stranded-DNA-specific exonuclease RecJ [Myroides odoratus]QQU03223.1 single-stranded-DNA-specific exonuclease RecJ [Myroides odoratus]STZ69521.1 Single-stranded-DNA-specific exonuclease recJ [Myroides odoratus]